MEKKREIVLYVIALVSALLAVLIVNNYVTNKIAKVKSEAQLDVKTVTVVEKPEVRSIVVAARDLYRGEAIEVEDITLLNVPTDALTVKGLFDDPNDLVGKVLNQDIYAGEWVIDRKLGEGDKSSSMNLANSLEEGGRAVRVAIDRVTGLSGVLRPSDFVDVVSVFKSEDGSRRISRTILENIEVLMVGNTLSSQQVSQDKDSDKDSQSSKDITLKLSQRDAETLLLAQVAGRIHFILRNPSDTQVLDSNGINVKAMEISNTQRRINQQVVPRAERRTIEVLQGGKVQEVTGK